MTACLWKQEATSGIMMVPRRQPGLLPEHRMLLLPEPALPWKKDQQGLQSPASRGAQRSPARRHSTTEGVEARMGPG